MLARLAKFFVIAALVLTTGAHWAALQTVAWTTMLANNLRTRSFTEAVSDTFDGEHPCCLCKAIKAGKKAEKNSESVAPVLKMEFPPTTEQFTLNPPAQFEELSASDCRADFFSPQPPVPPPRSFFV